MLDRSACNEWADKMKGDPAGWTAFRVAPPRRAAKIDDVRQAFEYCRDAIGWDRDLIVHCEGDYDLPGALALAEAIAPVKPLWMEDPLPPDFSESWVRLAQASKVPIAAGANRARRQGFRDFITKQGCTVVEPDVRNAGGLLESKKIAGLAEMWSLPVAAQNSGSAVSTMATVQWAAAVRDFLAAETVIGRGNWMDDVIVHEGGIVSQGCIAVAQTPGLGIELNPDTVKANLAEGERYWD